ncbi:MAG: RidA family protein [Rhodospirillales bacterium]|tara:strand:- start:498 stop:842 length:345 start_codon:yes stop_codon:yes gene_type:complete
MTIEHLNSGEILSQGTATDTTVYLCGLTGGDTSKDVAGQTRDVLAKIDACLAHFGTDKSKLLSAVIYLDDLRRKPAMNEVWKEWLGDLNRPARACVGAQLEMGTQVEIMVTAAK